MAWLPKQKVVVPIDFSEASFEAISTALEFVETPEHVQVIHALVPLEGLSPGVVWGEITDASREEAVRATFAEQRKKRGLPDVGFDVRCGDPGIEITEFAREEGADLIAIPSHGYGGVKRMVLGSVTERVLRHCTCAVLVLHRGEE